MITLATLITLVTLIANFALIFVIYHNKKGNALTAPTIFFVAALVALIGWASTNYLADIWRTDTGALWFTRATFPMGIMMAYFLALFVQSFPDGKPIRRAFIFLYTSLMLFVSIASLSPAVINSIVMTSSGIGDFTIGPLYLFAVVIYVFFIIDISITLLFKARSQKGIKKQQIILVITGWIIFFIGASMTNLIIPLLTENAAVSKIGPLFSTIATACITYGITKHQFLDLRLVIQRGLVYIILFSFIVFFYLGILFSLESFFQSALRTASVISAGVTSLIGIFTVPILERFFQRVTSNIFFKDNYDATKELRNMQNIMRTYIDAEILSNRIITSLSQLFHIRECALLSFHQQKIYSKIGTYAATDIPSATQIELAQIAHPYFHDFSHLSSVVQHFLTEKKYYVVMPIIFDARCIGILFLGAKKSGDPYTRKDHVFLGQVAFQLSAMLEKSHLFAQQKEYSATLEQQVHARTEEIATMQKSQEQMMLNISHALKTPLAILSTEIEMLAQKNAATELRPLRRSITEISKSIASLLKLARMESRIPIANKTHELIDLSALTELLFDYFCDQAQGKRIILTRTIQPDCFIMGDRNDIEELLINLVENAIKYMPHDKEKRHIHFTVSKKDAAKIHITIADTGNGISAEDLPHIFNRFYRVEKKENHDITGTGLGLAICKTITKCHGGTIDVESARHEGTKFIIILPEKVREVS